MAKENEIKVNYPTFQYLLSDPTQVRYKVDDKEKRRCIPKWKSIMVQTYQHGLPTPKEDEVLYIYSFNRGYLEKITKSFRNWINLYK